MDCSEFLIDDKQAEQIAMAILPDIAPYIKAHQKEYEQWLEQEAKNEC